MARLVPYTCSLAVMNLHDNRISLQRLAGFIPGAKLAASLKRGRLYCGPYYSTNVATVLKADRNFDTRQKLLTFCQR